MKKIVTIALASAMLLTASFSLYSCAENKKEPAPSLTGAENQTESQSEKQAETDNQSETEVPKIGSSASLMAAPDYEYQLWDSDDVVFGEVVEELDSRNEYARDDGYAIDGVITSYLFKVEKSYKGLLGEGKTIIVNVWNYLDTVVSEDGEEIGVWVEDSSEFYLHEGQRGVFMLSYPIVPSDREEFSVAYREEGIFEPKDSGSASLSADAAEVYASPSFEITLDQISADIARADEKFGDRDEALANGGGIFVDEDQSDGAE